LPVLTGRSSGGSYGFERKTLEEFDFAFQTSIRHRVIAPICASGPVGSGRLQWPGE
jgi:hypothetical protein